MQAIADINTDPFQEVAWAGKRVLIASSDAKTTLHLTTFFSGEGMGVKHARSDVETAELFEQESYQLLVIDTELEGDSLDLAHQIKLSSTDNFVPLLIITDRNDDLYMASCFDAGADDLVTKPYSEMLLFVRINALLKIGSIYYKEKKERKELAYYHAMMEEEQRLAKNIFSSIVHQDQLDQQTIQYTLSPMSIFNGDVLLSASTPNGHEYILLGDFTGHGLTASIGTLPVSEIFYAMTAKGFTLSTIIGEINRRLRALLPIGMFMATYAIAVNRFENTISIWGGGIPDLLFRRAEDASLERYRAKNLPIGVIDSSELDLNMEIIPVRPGDRFYIYTDGVIETENQAGDMFGANALLDVIANSGEKENIFEHIMLALEKFRDGFEQSDDITLLEYTYRPERPNRLLDFSKISSQSKQIASEWDVEMHFDCSSIKNYDPRPLLADYVVNIQGLFEYRSKLYTILSEMYANALDHGLLGLNALAKKEANAELGYAAERNSRLAALDDGYINVRLKNVLTGADKGYISITVEDSGGGFDHRSKMSVMTEDADNGIKLLQKLADKIEYNDKGNRVTAHCHWSLSTEQ